MCRGHLAQRVCAPAPVAAGAATAGAATAGAAAAAIAAAVAAASALQIGLGSLQSFTWQALLQCCRDAPLCAPHWG
jgi:hypothetical protein